MITNCGRCLRLIPIQIACEDFSSVEKTTQIIFGNIFHSGLPFPLVDNLNLKISNQIQVKIIIRFFSQFAASELYPVKKIHEIQLYLQEIEKLVGELKPELDLSRNFLFRAWHIEDA
jgi:hypothetical protein